MRVRQDMELMEFIKIIEKSASIVQGELKVSACPIGGTFLLSIANIGNTIIAV